MRKRTHETLTTVATCAALACALLAMIAMPVSCPAGPAPALGDHVYRIAVTASDVTAIVSLPNGAHSTYLQLSNDGAETVYLVFGGAATPSTGIPLYAGESLALPVSISTLGYVCDATKTTTLRGWWVY